MKAILISIKPKWVAKILNGEKTIEVRKTKPNVELPIDVYIYCTKEGTQDLSSSIINGKRVFAFGNKNNRKIKSLEKVNYQFLNGKIVAKFTLKKCQEWHNYSWQEITEKGCITDEGLRAYSKGRKSLYIWHIDDLVIFDKPKELSEFKQPRDSYGKVNWNANEYYYMELTKAPQNFCYVEDSLCSTN